MTEVAWVVLGAAAGAAAAWLLARGRARAESELAQTHLQNAFKAMAAEALRGNNEVFLSLAQETLKRHVEGAASDLDLRKKAVEDLLKPLNEALVQVREKSDALERERQQAYGKLSEQLQSVAATQERLRLETGNLVSALKQPNTRGKWGELTLRRVVELAGLSAHFDFSEQSTVSGEEGTLRPDLVVHLPNGRKIVVDAKAVLTGYLEAMEASGEEARQAALTRHAAYLREHVKALASKKYWEQFESADFVVLFVPGEPFLAAAVEKDLALIENAMKLRVMIATPTTLVALLKVVAYGWQQEQLTENAEAIATLGKEFYERVVVWLGHLQKLRGAIFDTVSRFDDALASLNSRVLPNVREMKKLGAAGDKNLPEIEAVQKVPRQVEAPRAE
jgi:DNA recombination protein RmuC